jgi:hypothetical protein
MVAAPMKQAWISFHFFIFIFLVNRGVRRPCKFINLNKDNLLKISLDVKTGSNILVSSIYTFLKG